MNNASKINWNPLYLNNQQVQDKIHELADLVSTHYYTIERGGLMTGLSGVAIFLNEYHKHFNISNSKIIEDVVEQAFDRVQRVWHSPSFCSGLTGLLWSVDYIRKNSSDSLDFEIDDLNDFLTNQMFDLAQKNDFDFLHGAGGMFYYFLSTRMASDSVFVKRFTDILYSSAKKEDANTIYWESIVDSTDPYLVQNIGLAHGMTSTILILAYLLHIDPNNEQVRELLTLSINFILKCKNDEIDLSIFPNFVSKNRVGNKNSRLGWCYGDLGIGIALLEAGAILDRQDIISEGFSVLIHTTTRQDTKRNSVWDAGLCHGSSGIAHIYNRIYQATNDQLFKDAALYWYSKTIDTFGIGTDSLGGYRVYLGTGEWKKEYNLLEGISGIGLSLLGSISSIEPQWDSCLLVDLNRFKHRL